MHSVLQSSLSRKKWTFCGVFWLSHLSTKYWTFSSFFLWRQHPRSLLLDRYPHSRQPSMYDSALIRPAFHEAEHVVSYTRACSSLRCQWVLGSLSNEIAMGPCFVPLASNLIAFSVDHKLFTGNPIPSNMDLVLFSIRPRSSPSRHQYTPIYLLISYRVPVPFRWSRGLQY